MRAHQSREWLRRASLMLGAAVALAIAGTAAPAQARVFFGFGVPFWGPPAYYYPPPLYYPPPPAYYTPPPPVYYTPPPVTYTPPAYAGTGPGTTARSCYAGAYVCPLEVRIVAGTTCWCPDNRGGRAYGRAE